MLHNIAAFACLSLWIKLFYFFRIFESTAVLVKMIGHIMQDIGSFLMMLGISILAFSNCLYILQMTRTKEGERFIYKDTKDNLLKTMIYTYNTGLGEYQYEEFGGNNSTLVWIVFIMITFAIQLVLMNLLIAIMGNAYAEI